MSFSLKKNTSVNTDLFHFSDGAWFDEGWLSRIKEDVGDNWRIKVVKKIGIFHW